jgi:hypothetical protein
VSRPAIVIDTETTGLDPARHQVWEVALLERDCGAERLWRIEPNVLLAEAKALEVGKFYERTARMRPASFAERSESYSGVWDLTEKDSLPLWSDPGSLAPHLAQLLDGATLIAANPTFDAGFLSAFLAAHCCHRDAARLAWQREFVRMAAVRRDAGMAADHPEDPGPPGDWESMLSGDDYAWFAAQLAGIEVTEP